ncbi:MAG: orotidine 5'-phosphate decarboxylase / HUMPS family protein [Acidimicrobiales bacterium]
MALDVDDLVAAIRLGRALNGHFGVAKIGLELYSAAGPEAIGAIAELGYKVFLDLKLHDIPTTVGKSARVLGAGVEYLTMHAHGGVEMLRAGVDGLEEGSQRRARAADLPRRHRAHERRRGARAHHAQAGAHRGRGGMPGHRVRPRIWSRPTTTHRSWSRSCRDPSPRRPGRRPGSGPRLPARPSRRRRRVGDRPLGPRADDPVAAAQQVHDLIAGAARLSGLHRVNSVVK